MHLLRRHLQFVLHMQRAGGEEGVDARPRGVAQGLPGAIDVGAVGARQPGDRRILGLPADFADRLEIAI